MANYLPANYGQNWGYSGVGQQMYPAYGQSMAAQPQMSYGTAQQQTGQGIIWVDGEVGAKAFQMPQGWSPNTPIPLWDTNDTIIYLKSINQMGMPNPLQKIKYQMEDVPQMLPAGQQSGTGSQGADYATKDDLSNLRTEIQSLKEMLSNKSAANQNGSNPQQGQNGNRGGNR